MSWGNSPNGLSTLSNIENPLLVICEVEVIFISLLKFDGIRILEWGCGFLASCDGPHSLTFWYGFLDCNQTAQCLGLYVRGA